MIFVVVNRLTISMMRIFPQRVCHSLKMMTSYGMLDLGVVRCSSMF